MLPAVTLDGGCALMSNFDAAAGVTVIGFKVADKLSVESATVIEVLVEAVVSVALYEPVPLLNEPVGSVVDPPVSLLANESAALSPVSTLL